jgi:hypothetical protein
MSVWAIVAQAVGFGVLVTIVSVYASAAGRKRNAAAEEAVEAERRRLGK